MKQALKIGILVGFFTSVITGAILFIYSNLNQVQILKISAIILLSISVIISVSFYYYLQARFREIYKIINQAYTENQRPAKNDSFEEVEQDVLDWASKRQTEFKRLKEAEKYRREFIGNLAHELKTPLFSVQGYILTLLEGGLEDERINRKFLMKASKGIDRMTTVIQDMDTITQIESGTLDLAMENFNINQVINNVFFELEEKASDKHRKLELSNNGKEIIMVHADRSKVTQVLYNLVINSIYYGNEHGKTTVEVVINKTKVYIKVIDDGPGIEKQHLGRLFERFYRVEKSRARNKGGSGIGLAIVKHIVEGHKQTINVESEVGKGTVFTFTLSKKL